MKIKEAIEHILRLQAEDLGQYKKISGIRLGSVLITPEMLASQEWGVEVINSNPEFVALVHGVIGDLKAGDGFVDTEDTGSRQ